MRDFYKFEADYDLVFTTTPLKSSMLQFMIEPIMTYQQQIGLRYRVLSDLGITKVDRAMDELLTIIRKYANITNPVSLREELRDQGRWKHAAGQLQGIAFIDLLLAAELCTNR